MERLNDELPLKIRQEAEKGAKNEEEKKLQLQEARKMFAKYKYNPQEAIGVLAAQSLSEPATQMTMRTYHFAGTAGIQVTLGLPRLIEIFDARKDIKTPTMTVYLLPEFQSVEKAKKVAESIKQVKLRDLVVSDIIDLTNLEITCKLDAAMLKELELDPEEIKARVKLKRVKIEVKGDELKAVSTSFDVRNLHKLKYRLMESHLAGMKDVTQAIVSKEDDEWVIHTLGSNLKKTLKIKGVDPYRTTSNNIFEITDVLGIEAGRNSIIKQSKYTLDEQGLNVDMRYIMLLADLMTVTGIIRPIGRYGIAGENTSVLARAAFEETKKHLISASIMKEYDDLTGVVENIMMNQLIPLGTGAYELVGSIPDAPAKKAEAEAEEAPAKHAKEERKVHKEAHAHLKKALHKKEHMKPAKAAHKKHKEEKHAHHAHAAKKQAGKKHEKKKK